MKGLSEDKLKRAKEFTRAYGDYIRALCILASESDHKEIYYDIAHDVPQGFTWLYKLLDGKELVGWQTNTEGIIAKCREARGKIWNEIEKARQIKSG